MHSQYEVPSSAPPRARVDGPAAGGNVLSRTGATGAGARNKGEPWARDDDVPVEDSSAFKARTIREQKRKEGVQLKDETGGAGRATLVGGFFRRANEMAGGSSVRPGSRGGDQSPRPGSAALSVSGSQTARSSTPRHTNGSAMAPSPMSRPVSSARRVGEARAGAQVAGAVVPRRPDASAGGRAAGRAARPMAAAAAAGANLPRLERVPAKNSNGYRAANNQDEENKISYFNSKPDLAAARKIGGNTQTNAEMGQTQQQLQKGWATMMSAFKASEHRRGFVSFSVFKQILNKYRVALPPWVVSGDMHGGDEINYNEFLRYFMVTMAGNESAVTGPAAVNLASVRGGGSPRVERPPTAPGGNAEIDQQVSGKWKSLMRACRQYDPQRTGIIPPQDMRRLLGAFAVPVGDQDLQGMPQGTNNGGIVYNDFIKGCLKRASES
jgi:hypothetical protein